MYHNHRPLNKMHIVYKPVPYYGWFRTFARWLGFKVRPAWFMPMKEYKRRKFTRFLFKL